MVLLFYCQKIIFNTTELLTPKSIQLFERSQLMLNKIQIHELAIETQVPFKK